MGLMSPHPTSKVLCGTHESTGTRRSIPAIHIQNPANSDFSDQISDASDSPNIPIFSIIIGIIGESEKLEFAGFWIMVIPALLDSN